MLNCVNIQGRLTDHPELIHTPGGNAVIDFTIAVERSRNGDGTRRVDFIKIVAWNAMAEFICKYFEKGQQIIVEGKISTNSYVDRNGNKRKDVYVLAKGADFCGAKSSEASEKDFTEAFDGEEELD